MFRNTTEDRDPETNCCNMGGDWGWLQHFYSLQTLAKSIQSVQVTNMGMRVYTN